MSIPHGDEAQIKLDRDLSFFFLKQPIISCVYIYISILIYINIKLVQMEVSFRYR